MPVAVGPNCLSMVSMAIRTGRLMSSATRWRFSRSRRRRTRFEFGTFEFWSKG
jgi:hypothetical protein